MKMLAQSLSFLVVLSACKANSQQASATPSAAFTLPTLAGAWIAHRFAGENSGPMREILLVLRSDGGCEATALLQEGLDLVTQRRTAKYDLEGERLRLHWTDFLDGSPKVSEFQIRPLEGGEFSIEDAHGKAIFEPWRGAKRL